MEPSNDRHFELSRHSLPPAPERELRDGQLPKPPYLTIECLSHEDRARFVAQREKLSADLLPFLTCCSLERYDADNVRLFLTVCGGGGYGLHADELVSVFSLPHAQLGGHLVPDAIRRGARYLECLDAHRMLSRFYGRFGFVEESRIAWDDRFAPAGWNYDRFGRPDLVRMALPAAVDESNWPDKD